MTVIEFLSPQIEGVRNANALTLRDKKREFYDALEVLLKRVPEEENVARLTRAELEKLGNKILISQGVRL